MLSKTLLVVGALASGFVSAAPTLVSRSPGSNWTVSEFTRTCNDTSNTCLYTYLISENDPSTNATACNYTISGSPTVSARTTDYTALAGCASPAYSLNQGWNAPGQFATLVVTNVTSQFRAFYGWGAPQLVDGVVQPDQTALSMTSGVAPAAAVVGVEERQNDGWTVEGFTWESDAPLAATYHFAIKEPLSGTFECTIIDAPSDARDSWSNEACLENENIIVSWGYNTQGFAVMTVRDNTYSPGYYALFGFGDVNYWEGALEVGPIGPQPVYEA